MSISLSQFLSIIDDLDAFTVSGVDLLKDKDWDKGISIRYISFAEKDLAEGGERGIANCVTNTKRALHSRVELITDALGYQEFHQLNKNQYSFNFPARVEFLHRCGLVAPRILKKFNRIRNILEHEYVIPTAEEAEDFLDVTEIFRAGTDYLLRCFPERRTFSDSGCWPQGIRFFKGQITHKVENACVQVAGVTWFGGDREAHRVAGDKEIARLRDQGVEYGDWSFADVEEYDELEAPDLPIITKTVPVETLGYHRARQGHQDIFQLGKYGVRA